jgi:hypothetical protein
MVIGPAKAIRREPGSVKLHFSLTGNFGSREEIEQFNGLEDELTTIADIAAYYTGREIGGGEATLFFEADDISTFIHLLLDVEGRLESGYLLRSARVVIRWEDFLDHEVEYGSLKDWLGANSRRARKKPKHSRKPELGDFYSIPLLDGRFGHATYVYRIPRYCDLLQVLDLITIEPAHLDGLIGVKSMFPPIKTVVSVGISRAGWQLVSHTEPDPNFRPPIFRGSNSASVTEQPGVYEDWWLSSGPNDWTFAGKLTEEMRDLEYDCFWNPWELADRIATGKNPYDRYR